MEDGDIKKEGKDNGDFKNANNIQRTWMFKICTYIQELFLLNNFR